MTTTVDPLDALQQMNLTVRQPPKSVWRDDTVVVESLHREVLGSVLKQYEFVKSAPSSGAKNIVLTGRPGVGKSHFLGRVRREVLRGGDLFDAVHLPKASDVWATLVLAYLEAMDKPNSGVKQLQVFLDALLGRVGLDENTQIGLLANVVEEASTKAAYDALRKALGRTPEAQVACDVALALILVNSDDFELQDHGDALLKGAEIDPAVQARFPFRTQHLEPRQVVCALDLLAGASGIVFVVALDQLDGLITVAHKALAGGSKTEINELANILMEFAERTSHTLIVLSCVRRLG